jgi:hypothetical protein
MSVMWMPAMVSLKRDLEFKGFEAGKLQRVCKQTKATDDF